MKQQQSGLRSALDKSSQPKANLLDVLIAGFLLAVMALAAGVALHGLLQLFMIGWEVF